MKRSRKSSPLTPNARLVRVEIVHGLPFIKGLAFSSSSSSSSSSSPACSHRHLVAAAGFGSEASAHRLGGPPSAPASGVSPGRLTAWSTPLPSTPSSSSSSSSYSTGVGADAALAGQDRCDDNMHYRNIMPSSWGLHRLEASAYLQCKSSSPGNMNRYTHSKSRLDRLEPTDRSKLVILSAAAACSAHEPCRKARAR